MSRRQLVWVAAAFVVTRLAVLALFDPEIHRGDQAQYLRVAGSLSDWGVAGYLNPDYQVVRGDYYPYFRGDASEPDGSYNPLFWDPLYPLFVAVVLAIAGPSTLAIHWTQILLSFATLCIGMSALRRMFPDHDRVPIAFGWLFVAYLPLAGFTTKIMAETLDAFLLTSLVWAATRLPGGALRAGLIFGLILGTYASIKSYFFQMMPLVVGLIGLAYWQERTGEAFAARSKYVAPRLILIVLATLTVLAPTWIRTSNLTGGVALISTKGPWNFWKDNNNFQLVQHDWREPNVKVHNWLEQYYVSGSEALVSPYLKRVYADETNPIARPPCTVPLAELAACERNRAIVWALEDPLRFASRAIRKVANLWSPNNYIFNRAPRGNLAWHQNYRIELPDTLRWLLQFWVIGTYIFCGVAFFAALALPVQSSADRYARGLAVLCLTFLTLVVVPVGHGVSRFRLPFMLPVLMYAALAVVRRAELGGAISALRTSASPWRLVLGASFGFWAALVLSKLPLLLRP